MGEENRLSQLEAWWSSVWELEPHAMLITDGQGRVDSGNPAAEKMFGYDNQELIGLSLQRLMPEIRMAAPGGPHELVARRRDGSTFPVRAVLGEFSVAGKSGITAILRDTTSTRRREAWSRQREEQLKLTIQYAPTGICTVDLNGEFLTVNQAFCRMVGYSEEELLHRPVNSITHRDDVELAETRLRQLRDGQIEQYRVRKRYTKKNGGVVEGVMTAAVVHDLDGSPLLYVAQVEDLTERLKAEREASENRERLAHVTRVQMIGEMVAGIAHEINQPLTAIATYAQASGRMIRAGMLQSEELLAAMDKISRQAQRAGDVIRHLRRLVRERSSTGEMIDLNELIADIVPLAEVDARMHDSMIELNLADALPSVLIDPIQIQQVVLNLVRNGMEAMAHNEAGEKMVTISSSARGGDTVEVSVQDRGAGISSDAEKELFRTFFTTKNSGMGMGLAISRSIVNAHGGSLWFTRNPDRGTTFHVSLPVAGGGDDEES